MQNPAKVRGIFSSIAARYDLANHLLSGGLDFFWRARAVRMVVRWEPSAVLDLATGSGDLALALQKALPQAHVVGADFCLPMLQVAARKGLRPLVAADGTKLPFAAGSFDAITVAFGLRNMESWPAALREMSRVLRPGGHLLLLDFSLPRPPSPHSTGSICTACCRFLPASSPGSAPATNTSANRSRPSPPARPCASS